MNQPQLCDWVCMFYGYLYLIRVFLPSMLEKNYGYIVGIASAAVFNGNPYISSYCASKAAVLSLHESLTAELKRMVYLSPVLVLVLLRLHYKFLNESIKGMLVLTHKDAA